jgi:hypothetical protein
MRSGFASHESDALLARKRIDNDSVQNCIRPIAIGRQNRLLPCDPRGPRGLKNAPATKNALA